MKPFIKYYFNHHLLVLLFFIIQNKTVLNAQNENIKDSIPKYKHAVGAGVGFTTGYGLSYRYTHIASKIGFQVNFAPYSDESLTQYSAGLTFLYTLIENPKANLFLYQGNHYFYKSEILYYDSFDQAYYPNNQKPTNMITSTIEQTDSYFNNGLGIGVEFILIKRISFNLMGGYAAYKNFKYLSFTGETGLYYKF